MYPLLQESMMGSLYNVVIYSKHCSDLDASSNALQLLHSELQQTGFCWWEQGHWGEMLKNKEYENEGTIKDQVQCVFKNSIKAWYIYKTQTNKTQMMC